MGISFLVSVFVKYYYHTDKYSAGEYEL